MPKFLKSVLWGLAAALAVSAVMLVCLSFAALGGKDPDSFTGTAAYLSFFSGCAAGGFLSARICGERGLFTGGMSGVLFVLLLLLLSGFFGGVKAVWMPFAGAAVSAASGVLGLPRASDPEKERKRKKRALVSAKKRF